jgi:acyl transferase domain-containing protein
VQVALVDLLASFGILPDAVVGHSSGEIAAAYAAGALSKTSALKVAYFRGEASEDLLAVSEHDRGAMLAVALSEAESKLHIDAIVGPEKPELLSCGCINSPTSTTVTGVETLVDELSVRLNSKGIFNRKLNVPIAYHSPQMRRVASKYRESLSFGLEAAVSSDREMVRFSSSVTGQSSSCNDLTSPDYWVNNLVSQVKFSQALQHMISHSSEDRSVSQASSKRLISIIEVGPHAALERSIKDTLMLPDSYIYSSALRRNISAVDTVQDVVGLLWTHGFLVDLNIFNAKPQSERRPKMLLDLPSYPFNRSRTYWHESRLSKNDRLRQHPRHDLLGIPSSDWNPMEPKWRFTIRTSDIPWLSEHQVGI